jgi:peptide/nickel transport system permease protein
VTTPPDDPNRESIPLLLARKSRGAAPVDEASLRAPRRGAPGAQGPHGAYGPSGAPPRPGERERPGRATPARPPGFLRSTSGALGALLAVSLVLIAIFADLLASDLPVAARLHGQLWLFPNVTQPSELVAMGGDAVNAEAEWSLAALVAHGPGAGRGTGTAAPLLPPGRVQGHPFGTDREGRDVFARVVHGARTYLVFALGAVLVSLVFGGLLGAVAGLFGGATDAVVGRAIETVSAFPPLVLVLGIQAAVPRATAATLFLAIAITRWPEVARLVRAEVMQVATRDYVLAARALGASPLRVLRRHVAPNVRGQLIVLGATGVPAVILIEASLDFLRIGGTTGGASWGETMSEFRDAPAAWWLLAFPAALLFMTIVALTLVGEARRELADPRAR